MQEFRPGGCSQAGVAFGDHRTANANTQRTRSPRLRSRVRRPRRLGDDDFGMRGLLNEAIFLYLSDATLASAFAARWCAGSNAETAGGVSKFGG
jgi:hypothetical protein